MIGTICVFLSSQGSREVLLCRLGVPPLTLHIAHIDERRCNYDGLRTVQSFIHGKRLPKKHFGLIKLSLHERISAKVLVALGYIGMLGPKDFLFDGEGTLI